MSSYSHGWREYLRRHLLTLIIITLALFLPLQFLFRTTTELAPVRNADVQAASRYLGCLAAVAAALLAVATRQNEGGSRALTIFVFGALGGVLGFVSGLVIGPTIYQTYDFSGPGLIRRPKQFPIVAFYQTHGRGQCNHVVLRDYGGNFCIGTTDYKKTFGRKESGRVDGLCLLADTEENGAAVRIMHSSELPFRPGAVVKCRAVKA